MRASRAEPAQDPTAGQLSLSQQTRGGGLDCAKCRIWFHFYKNSIFLRPYRGPSSIISANSQEREHPSSDDMYLARSLRQRRIDTPDFKYIKIAMVKLPNTPRKNFSAIAKKDFTPSRATRSWGGKYQDG